MDIEFIERLIALLDRSRCIELDYVEGDTRVRVLREVDPRAGQGSGDRPPGANQTTPPASGSAASGTRPPASDHVIAAGIVGTFFRSPGPGQPPFVSEGDLVEEGQTLAILEAMKTLNPVEADRAGRILRIHVEDGVAVEAGTPIFTIALAD